jgi:hypothetical protein
MQLNTNALAKPFKFVLRMIEFYESLVLKITFVGLHQQPKKISLSKHRYFLNVDVT